MTRARKWMPRLGLAMGVLALLALLAMAVFKLIPSDQELARRVTTELEARLGVPLSVGAVHWQLLPSPRVVIENAVTRQPQPLEVRKLTAYLNPATFWQRRLELDRAEVQGAVLPQLSLRELGLQPPSAAPNAPEKFEPDALQLQTQGQGELHVTGQFQPQGIEAVSALQAFHHSAIVAGKTSGETTLSASGASLAELAQSLHTRTKFSMGRSTLLRFDLDKAIRSLGREHTGKTPLDAITGQLDPQNTPQGMVATGTHLKTRSGALSASSQGGWPTAR